MIVRVDTVELHAVAGRLESVATEFVELSQRLAGTNWFPTGSELFYLPAITLVVEAGCAAAVVGPGAVLYAGQLSIIAGQLRAAAVLYDATEAGIELAITAAGELATWLATKALAFLLFTPAGHAIAVGIAIRVATGAAAGIAIVELLPEEWRDALASTLGLDAVAEMLADVNWAPLLRTTIDIVGRLPYAVLPLELQSVLPSEGASATAGFLYALMLFTGVFTPPAFTVVRTSETRIVGDGAPPSLGDLVGQVPRDASQVTVTSYVNDAGETIYAIAIRGTSAGLPGSTEPLDGQSNLGLYGGFDAEAIDAVYAALEAAGVPAGATVALTGYSQGAMVAHGIAASGKYNVELLTTVGSPARPTGVPEGITVIEIEHEGDVVPALAGSRPEGGDGSVHIVRPTAGTDAHGIDNYEATAAGLEGEHARPSDELAAALARKDELFAGYTATGSQSITVERGDAPEALPGTVPWMGEQLESAVAAGKQGVDDAAAIVHDLIEEHGDVLVVEEGVLSGGGP